MSSKFRCSPDPKTRLQQLVHLYSSKLTSSTTTLDAAAVGAAIDRPNLALPLTQGDKEVFETAVAMAKLAFRSPPVFFVSPADQMPTHCLHLNVFTSESINACDDPAKAVALISGAVASLEAFLFAFADTPEGFELKGEAATPVFKGFTHINRLGASGPLCDGLSRALDSIVATDASASAGSSSGSDAAIIESAAARPLFGGGGSVVGTVTPQQLKARAVWVAFLALDGLSAVTFDKLCAAVSLTDQSLLLSYMETVGKEVMEGLVMELQNQFAMALFAPQADHKKLGKIATLLQLLYTANTRRNTRGIISHKTWYNATVVDFDRDAIIADFERSRQNRKRPPDQQLFCFSSYPCLVDAKFKSMLMQIEGIVEQNEAMRGAMVSSLFGGRTAATQHFLALDVKRDNLVQTSLQQLQRKSTQLKKPLRVTFVGEEGIDEGGLRKEWMQLITKELLTPNYGMFTEQETTRLLWFQPTIRCPHNKPEFYLIGQVLGLAVYNNIILECALPKVLFRKLLNITPDFEDLREIDPDLAAGLTELLRFEEEGDDTIENVFCRSFVYEYDVFGETKEVELCPNGANITLTGQNRQRYVDLVVQHVLTDSIQGNFDEFKRGFTSVADRNLMSSMVADELELLVCGSPVLDFKELEAGTRYDGCEKTDHSIQLLWEVLHEFSLDEKRAFLKFCTGSDRVPIGGLRELGFIIGKNGDDSDMLPTSHTCFNHFLLPQYKTKDKLREKLLLAIQNCHGFGLK